MYNTRADCIDANALLDIFQGGHLGHANYTVFRGRIGAKPREPNQSGYRCSVYDGSAALFEHDRNLIFHAQKDALKIDGNNPVKHILRVIGQRLIVAFDSGVIGGIIQPAVFLDRLSHHVSYFGRLRDIHF